MKGGVYRMLTLKHGPGSNWGHSFIARLCMMSGYRLPVGYILSDNIYNTI